ncbi:MAG TPA: NAD(P)H-binding protein [Candidatus Ruania gallistercoris]|uniref:NAD(P)H-binding protein n=1 Tax=Candidatus Ruania gallistercoris TaxID=2838746 RepID=A0A9D2EFX0_9MICO|nr:NAD(P)H-binding protein [Candidatus Ruania gallistercoris]
MRISVLGATGMAGSAIVGEALDRGHAVTAVSRTASTTAQEERLRHVAVDLTGAGEIHPLLAACDAAVLTVRFAPDEHQQLAPVTRRVLEAAAHTGTRVLVVGGSAPLSSPSDPERPLIDDPEYVPAQWRSIAQASLDQFHECRRHTAADWVYLSPPAVFEPGARTGSYRRGTNQLVTSADGTSRITPGDLALAVLDELENPGPDRHFTVAQAG